MSPSENAEQATLSNLALQGLSSWTLKKWKCLVITPLSKSQSYWFNNSQVHLGVGGGAQIDTGSITDVL